MITGLGEVFADAALAAVAIIAQVAAIATTTSISNTTPPFAANAAFSVIRLGCDAGLFVTVASGTGE